MGEEGAEAPALLMREVERATESSRPWARLAAAYAMPGREEGCTGGDRFLACVPCIRCSLRQMLLTGKVRGALGLGHWVKCASALR